LRRLALLVFFTLTLSALVVYATTNIKPPVYADTSKSYVVGYEVSIKVGQQNITVVSTNASIDHGPRIGALEVYNDIGNASQVVVPPPETQTVTRTYTYTTTVTKTVTGPGGKTTVVTTVETVTVPPGPGSASHRRALLLGLGALAFLLLLLARR